MKQKSIIITSFLSLALVVLLSCQKKDKDGISPGFKENSGTGGNPNANNPTVTGASTATNPATQNSVINNVGGSGWSNPTCSSLGNSTLRGISGNTKVTINFFTAPLTGTYAIGAAPSGGVCSLNVENAPNQPAGIVWYGKSGVVVVNSTTTAVNASFSNIQCVQANFSYPAVTVSGVVGCTQ